MENSSGPFVSVIIPVFNDAVRLRICLEALENQTYPKYFYEIVVVDNASDEAEKVEEIVAQFSQAIATYEQTPGSYAARNKGISLAKGEIIAFTDADCIPTLDWIEKGVASLLQVTNCGLITGRINIFFKDSNRATLVELYESVTAFPQEDFIKKYKGGATANLFTFKQVIDQVGLFNTKLKSGGDLEWGQRVHALGYQQVYADDACVAHPARSSLEQLHKKTRRVAGGVYDLYMKQEYSLFRRIKTFFRLLFDDLLLTLRATLKIVKDSNLRGIKQKLRVSSVIILTGYINMSEKIDFNLEGFHVESDVR